ncbi:hypothetical protein ON010_g14263 [Phytophthora cinnamomi]|nr:hypothetical protein ON010_g14263 [Phytophthora cinnamomi]
MEDTTSTSTDTKLVFTDSDAVTTPNDTPSAAADASQADLQAQLALFQQQQQQYIQQLVRLSVCSVIELEADHLLLLLLDASAALTRGLDVPNGVAVVVAVAVDVPAAVDAQLGRGDRGGAGLRERQAVPPHYDPSPAAGKAGGQARKPSSAQGVSARLAPQARYAAAAWARRSLPYQGRDSGVEGRHDGV